MDFLDELKKLSDKLKKVGPTLASEEATKTALVMPFIRALGYDVFNTDEVMPEFVATSSDKKDQRVDYAIMKDGCPIILIECKALGTPLEYGQADQLRKYFNCSTTAPVGILTDGNIYKFFTDLEQTNLLDKTPYMTFTLEKIDKRLIPEIQKLGKDRFDPDDAVNAAEKLKYTGMFKEILEENVEEPKDELVKFFLSQSDYEGRATVSVLAKFKDILKDALEGFIADKITDRLTAALDAGEKKDSPQTPSPATEEPKTETPEPSFGGSSPSEEEMQGYYIVKSILGGVCPLERITIKDKQTLCNIPFDGNIRKPIIKFFFEENKLVVGLITDDNKVDKHSIEKLDDIYGFADQIKAR